jgi:spore coat polysaccharide biosynthesis protein SpsF
VTVKTVGVVQARLGSTRLPGKMLMTIGSYSITERMYINLQRCMELDDLIFAIPDSTEEDSFAAFLIEKQIPFIRGSVDNLVDRHLAAAASVGAEVVVRVPGDNPFVDSREVDRAVRLHLKRNRDGFTTNLSPFGKSKYPDGIGAEVFDVRTLEKYTKDKTGEFLEHVHLSFLDYKSGWQVEKYVPVLSPRCPLMKRCRNLRLDVNTIEDLVYLRMLVADLGDFPTIKDIIKWYHSL